MDGNSQDSIESKQTATGNTLPPSSSKGLSKLVHLAQSQVSKVLTKLSASITKHPLLIVAMSVALLGAIVLIYMYFRLNWPWRLIPLTLVGILLLIFLIRIGYTAQWTGFGEYDKETKEYTNGQLPKTTKKHQPGKTFWDWLQLLIIPLVLAGATIGFGSWQAELAYGQHQNDLKIAQDNRKSDMQVASSQQEEATLQTYLDSMSDLLLNPNYNLAHSKPGDEVRQVARERTVTTLGRLHDGRNRIVLQFLQDAHLIGTQDAVIDLSNADLSTDDLSGADLSNANLSVANLTATDLSNANLSSANLSYANLSKANLSNADLSTADLSGATLTNVHLDGVHLNGSHLSYTDLSGADLSGADLSGADLSNATLTGADLSKAILNAAFLSGADLDNATLNKALLSGAFLGSATLNSANLQGANLSYANLSYANLSGADLTGANLTPQQLKEVYSCTNTILSKGLVCPPNNRRGSIVTLTYWYTESSAETPVILQLIKKFEQRYPNIKINAVPKSFFQTQAGFITAAQAGHAPDVLRSDVGWITQFASQGYLLPLDKYISRYHLNLSDYLNVPLSYDKYPQSNGRYYGLPQVTDCLALLYNKVELAKVGIKSPAGLATMDDFKKAAMNIVQSKVATYGFETTGTAYYVLPFLYAFGGGMFDKHNNIVVNSKGSVKGLNFLLQLQNNDKVMPTQVDFSNGNNNMVNDFMSGKTAMIFDGPWDVLNILKNGSAFTGNPDNLGIAAVPMGPTGQVGSPVGGQSYVVSASTKHPAEAYKFISFMSSTASQVAIAEANYTLPTLQSAYHDPQVSGDPVISAFHSPAIQKTAVARPAIPQGAYLFDAFDPNIEAALDGVESSTDALNAVYDAWNQLLGSS